MQTIDNQEELRKARIALSINLAASAVMLLGLIFSIHSKVEWRIICSSISVAAFLFLTFAVFIRLLKLQKQSNS